MTREEQLRSCLDKTLIGRQSFELDLHTDHISKQVNTTAIVDVDHRVQPTSHPVAALSRDPYVCRMYHKVYGVAAPLLQQHCTVGLIVLAYVTVAM